MIHIQLSYKGIQLFITQGSPNLMHYSIHYHKMGYTFSISEYKFIKLTFP